MAGLTETAGIVARIRADTSSFTTNLRTSQKSLVGLQKETTKLNSVNKTLTSTTKLLGNAMVGLDRTTKNVTASLDKMARKTRNGFLALTGAIGATVKVSADFDTAMRRVGSISNATTDQLVELTKVAREAGKSTVFSAKEAAGALENLALAGFSVEESTNALDGTLQLAAALQIDLAEATELVAGQIRAYSLDAGEAERVSNVLAAGVANSMASFEKLQYSLTYTSPLFNTLKLEIEDNVAALGLLYNANFRGEQAGRALRGAISRLLNPTKEMEQALAQAGIRLEDVNVQTNDLSDVFRALEPLANDASLAMRVFDRADAPAMMALLSQGADAFDRMRKSITGTTQAQDMVEKHTSSLNMQFTKLKSAIQDGAIAIGDYISPAVQKLVEYISGLVESFNALDEETKQKIAKWAVGIALGLGAVTLVAFGLSTALKGLNTVTQLVLLPLNTLLNLLSLSPLLTDIVLIAGGAYLLYKAWDENWYGLKDVTEDVINTLQLAFTKLLTWLDETKEKVTDSKAWKWTVDVALPEIIEKGKVVIKAVIEAVGDLYEAIKEGLNTGDWSRFWVVASNTWSKGIILAVGLSSAVKGIGAVTSAIISGLGLVGSTLGMSGIIGLMSIGLQFKEAQAEGSFTAFFENVVLGALLGVLTGLTFNPTVGMWVFTISVNLRLGERIADTVREDLDYISYMLQHMNVMDMLLGKHPEEMMSKGEWQYWKETGIKPDDGWIQSTGRVFTEEEVRRMNMQAMRDSVPLDSSTVTDHEKTMLAALAELEAGVDGIKGMSAVVEVVFNRMEENAELYGATIEEVIRKANQFEPVTTGAFDNLIESGEISAEAIEAVDIALRNLAEGISITGNAVYFANLDIVRSRNPNHWMLDSSKMNPTAQIGKTTYGTAGYKNKTFGFAKGGFTGIGMDTDIAGFVHKNEYVIPAWMAKQLQPLISMLEKMRLKGYADGGSVGNKVGTWASWAGTQMASFDYEKIFTEIKSFFFEIGDFVEDLRTSFFDNLPEEQKQVVDSLIDKWNWLFDEVEDEIEEVEDSVSSVGKEADKQIEEIKVSFRDTVKAIIEDVFDLEARTQIANSAIETLGNVIGEFSEELGGIISSFKVKLRESVIEVEDGVEVITEAFIDWKSAVVNIVNAGLSYFIESLFVLFSDMEDMIDEFEFGSRGNTGFVNFNEMYKNFSEWEKNRAKLLEAEQKQTKVDKGVAGGTVAGGAIGATIGAIFSPIGALIGAGIGSLFGRGATKKVTEDTSKATAEEIETLRLKLQDTLAEIADFLGTSINDIANNLNKAFSAGSYADFVESFGQSLEDMTKQALINAFIASDTMQPLLDELSQVITLAVAEGTINNPEVQKEIQGLQNEITDAGKQAYDLIQDLDITGRGIGKSKPSTVTGGTVLSSISGASLDRLTTLFSPLQYLIDLPNVLAHGNNELVSILRRIDDKMQTNNDLLRDNSYRGSTGEFDPVGSFMLFLERSALVLERSKGV